MIRNDDYFEIIKEQNKELAKFRPFASAYEMKKEIEKLNNIIKEVREYIEEKYDYILKDDIFLDHDEEIDRKRLLHILEILDKGE